MDSKTISLNQGCKFFLGDCEDAWYRGYDDKEWQDVMLPHDWSVMLPFSKEYSSGTGYLAGGIGWYRIPFELSKEYQGKNISVVFDGIYKNSQVWCNSYYLGKRPNGYTTFSYDISSFVDFEHENIITVKVSHTDIADSRWFTGSGMTRKAMLLIQEPVHPKEDGIIFRTECLSNEHTEIEIEEQIVNGTDQTVRVKVDAELWDTENECVLNISDSIEVDKENSATLTLRNSMENPKLWSPQYPVLYTLRTYYSVNGGQRYQVEEKKVGIRSFNFTPEEGFFINGQPMKIKGVCVHHDAGCLGAAVTAEIWQRRLETLKQCGCNAIRCSHNPHMPELYDLCDVMGFLVMDEAFDEWENAKNKWSVGHNVYPPKHQGYFEDFPQWHEADLRAMVRRDRNHPSVILWSIGNEIDYPNDPYCHPMFQSMTGNNDANKPGAERLYDYQKPNTKRLVTLAKHLSEIVKQEDKTRPVTMALAFPELSAKLGMLESLDVVGYNYKEFLYEEDHQYYPDKPFLGSENSHSYDAWCAVKDNQYISGQFLWTGIDYLGEAHGWPIHGSAAGLLDCAGFEKSRFYRRKALWLTEPVLKLATRSKEENDRDEEWLPCIPSWNYVTGEKVVVMCYSNLPMVRILLNGKEVAKAKKYNSDGAYRFEIPFEEGILLAEGFDEDGILKQTDSLVTTGTADRLKVDLWSASDASGGDFSEASGKKGYIYQLMIGLCDASGNMVTSEDYPIHVSVEGPGVLQGIENGDLSDNTPYSMPWRRSFHGRAIAYVRRCEVGNIKVVITTDGENCKMCEVIL